ncbi:hypothetical protein [Nonomuraea sp. KM90]|uniref:hypothetical protein n=1 Tax=Nonomuraea sp. KM90 TaxID=3457428 RepID=UPI003FCD8C68
MDAELGGAEQGQQLPPGDPAARQRVGDAPGRQDHGARASRGGVVPWSARWSATAITVVLSATRAERRPRIVRLARFTAGA